MINCGGNRIQEGIDCNDFSAFLAVRGDNRWQRVIGVRIKRQYAANRKGENCGILEFLDIGHFIKVKKNKDKCKNQYRYA